MANYVYNRVVCRKEILEKYFVDSDPFGDGNLIDPPYITFNKLFDVKSINEYSEKIGAYIYYGYGFLYREMENGRYEIKFCTWWEYPIQAITRVIELAHDTVWYAVEENCVYASKFYWENTVKEDVIYIEDEYNQWEEEHEDFWETLDMPDDGIWYFLPTAKGKWNNWESLDGFARYRDIPVVDVPLPF